MLVAFLPLVLLACHPLLAKSKSSDQTWDSSNTFDPQGAFEILNIPSSTDGAQQKCYAYKSTSEKPMPLLVSLHTWSGSYAQRDELSELAQKKNWNVIHPDFRGPNKTPQACGSALALSDIDDAIEYALAHFPVDKSKIFVVGVSGGGHAACLNYLTTRHPVNTTFAWVPITDIEAWYYQSKARKRGYAKDILAATRSQSDQLNVEEARARSPLYKPVPEGKTSPIRIYAGINDGYSGTVPISHSLLFYNRLASAFGDTANLVPEGDIISLVSRGMPGSPRPAEKIGDRDILYEKKSPLASVTIFDGSHEMIVDYCMGQMEEIVLRDSGSVAP